MESVGVVRYVNSVFAAFDPPGVVTITLASPAARAGVVHVAVVLLVTLKAAHATPPTVMAVAPVKSVPVSVIAVPPAVVPEAGLTEVTVGGGMNVNRVLAAFVPFAVVTRTLAVPAVPEGVVQVIDVAETTVMLVQADPPIVTALAAVRL